jgi:hypothetical protein
MNSRLSLIILAVVLLSTGCSGLSIYTDFDREADFASIETFAWRGSNQTLAISAPLVHGRIIAGIENGFKDSGLTQVDSDPDVYIDYHTDAADQFRVDTTHVSMHPSWNWNSHWVWSSSGGMGATTSTSRVHQYQQGTLIIDVWYAAGDQLIWRGSAEAAIPSNPSRTDAKIDRAIERMISDWQRRSE